MWPDSKVEQAIAALSSLSRNELAARWEKIYHCPPPKGLGRKLLERAAAWHLQRQLFGGLSAEGRRRLHLAIRDVERQLEERQSQKDLGQGASSGVQPSPPASGKSSEKSRPINLASAGAKKATRRSRKADGQLDLRAALPPGARLIRQWNGRQHFVDVVEGGYVLEGKTYRSLSAVARKITGAHWSGPRFFGL